MGYLKTTLLSTTTFLADLQLKKEDLKLPEVEANDENLQKVFQILFGIIALLTVLYIMITGLKLVAQQGDPQGISKARQGIIYASIGLVIALSAELIVTFVIGRL